MPTAVRGQGILDFGGGVGGTRAGRNASLLQPLIGRQRLEQADGAVEEVRDFLRWLIVGVAIWVKSRNTSPVLAPLVLPEGLGRA